jgi:uncharacterized protein (DUF305 family)
VCSAARPARQEAEIIEAQRREMDQMKQLIAISKTIPFPQPLRTCRLQAGKRREMADLV